jgi:hypothetical protein
MKIQKIIFACLLVVSFINSGCKKSTGAAASTTSSSGGGSSKVMLSAWAVANSSFSYRLDTASSSGANLSGTPFTVVVKYSDNSEVHCASSSFSGTETSGSYDIANCTAIGSGMCTSSPTSFESGGAGTYSNNGTTLTLCKADTTCYTYH